MARLSIEIPQSSNICPTTTVARLYAKSRRLRLWAPQLPRRGPRKKRLSEELANLLNSFGDGATKSADKWMKAWADWKSDIKAKARKIRLHRMETGGGPPPTALSSLEQEVLDFLGPVSVDGLDVPDPLQLIQPRLRSRSRSPIQSPQALNSLESINITIEESNTSELQTSARDSMLNAMRLQAEAAMRQAVAMERIASAMHAIAEALKK